MDLLEEHSAANEERHVTIDTNKRKVLVNKQKM